MPELCKKKDRHFNSVFFADFLACQQLHAIFCSMVLRHFVGWIEIMWSLQSCQWCSLPLLPSSFLTSPNSHQWLFCLKAGVGIFCVTLLLHYRTYSYMHVSVRKTIHRKRLSSYGSGNYRFLSIAQHVFTKYQLPRTNTPAGPVSLHWTRRAELFGLELHILKT